MNKTYNLSNDFGKRVKQLREELTLTQEEFGYRCNLQASHISQIERGEKNPTLDTIYKIANGFNLSLPQLLDFSIKLEVASYDETTNKIIACLAPMSKARKEQILAIIQTFNKPETR